MYMKKIAIVIYVFELKWHNLFKSNLIKYLWESPIFFYNFWNFHHEFSHFEGLLGYYTNSNIGKFSYTMH